MYIGIDVYCFVIIVGGYTDNGPSSRLSRNKITTPNSTPRAFVLGISAYGHCLGGK